jgi:methyltransferase (TIGR00027 family)
MRDDAPSRTAAFVAAARQLGHLLPPEARLVEDPYGVAFTSPMVSSVLERESERLRLVGAMPGLRSWLLYMQVRTRVIDDALREFVKHGGRQLVLLGAGFDCRALRIPELAHVDVFEVDHPATQARKREILERIGADSPSTYVTWDFETRPMDELPEILADAGLDRAERVFTVWEGVTMYLTEAAIDASLRAIRAWSPAGSQLAMTYFAKSRVDRPNLLVRVAKTVVASLGEPWRFGWSDGELSPYLADRDLTLVRDIALADAARELLPASYAALLANPDRRFAIAASPEAIALVS